MHITVVDRHNDLQTSARLHDSCASVEYISVLTRITVHFYTEFMRYDHAPRYEQDYETASFFDGHCVSQREPHRRRTEMHHDNRTRQDALGMDNANPQCKFARKQTLLQT